MERRIFAIAASVAALALLGSHPASASQCTQGCDKAYQDCNGAAGANAQACLPKWGQCKKACAGPVAAKPAAAAPVAMTPAKAAAPTPKAKVSKVSTTKTKTTSH